MGKNNRTTPSAHPKLDSSALYAMQQSSFEETLGGGQDFALELLLSLVRCHERKNTDAQGEVED